MISPIWNDGTCRYSYMTCAMTKQSVSVFACVHVSERRHYKPSLASVTSLSNFKSGQP